ncbi:MAG: lamin tail domain-containing protein, partial [Xanthomonadales bacterium]|nr:lamin tail domain-containing protein [Xanthomonadales bacterium]
MKIKQLIVLSILVFQSASEADNSMILLGGDLIFANGFELESLVINEIDYDQPGSDTEEFIEIYNPTSSEISLNGIRLYLVNGGTFSDYDEYFFSDLGSMQPGQYLVVGSDSVLTSLPPGTISMPLNGSIQNGSSDGVVLIDTSDNSIIDSVSYEGNLTGVTITDLSITIDITEGTSSLTDTIDGSLSRIPNGEDSNNNDADFLFTSSTTPGSQNA